MTCFEDSLEIAYGQWRKIISVNGKVQEILPLLQGMGIDVLMLLFPSKIFSWKVNNEKGGVWPDKEFKQPNAKRLGFFLFKKNRTPFSR